MGANCYTPERAQLAASDRTSGISKSPELISNCHRTRSATIVHPVVPNVCVAMVGCSIADLQIDLWIRVCTSTPATSA